MATLNQPVYRGDGVRLYGLDAELELKAQSKRDLNAEKELGIWIEKVIGEKLKHPEDLIESLRSGIVLCKLLNSILPGTIKNVNTTRDTALHHMENIGLYLKACWKVGIQSSDLFNSSDLYLRKNVLAVIQNLLAIARSTHSLPDYNGPQFDYIKKPNLQNVQPAKKWDQIEFKQPLYVTDLEKQQQHQNSISTDCNKCGIEKVCVKCNPPPPQQQPITKVNSILEEKEKEKEKEFMLKIQNLLNTLKEKEEAVKILNDNLEKQKKKNIEDEKLYKDQLLSKENLILSLNKTNSSLISLTSNSNNNNNNNNNSNNNNQVPSSVTGSSSSSSTSNINKSNRNSGVFQNVALYNNKSVNTSNSSSSISTTPTSSNISITSISSILSKCTRCNFTTTKSIKYCSACGGSLAKEGEGIVISSLPNTSTKPPIALKSNANTVVSSLSRPASSSVSIIGNNNENDKINTLITTMKQQEDVISKLNQQIKLDKEMFEKEKKQQKQIIDNQQVLLNQKELDLKKAISNSSSTNNNNNKQSSLFITPSKFVGAELKSENNVSTFSRPYGNSNSSLNNNTTTISNKELEILRDKIKNLEIKLNDEVSKSKVKDSQIVLLNDKILSFNNRPKRPMANNNNIGPAALKGSQIVVGRKRFNTIKPDSVELSTLVDATLMHLTTILYSKPIEFYQVNSLKELFKTELGRRRFSQILASTLKTVPSLQMNESSFEFLLFLISCALQEMNLSKDNDMQSAQILFHSSDLLYRINPKTGQSEFLKDYVKSANIFKQLEFWNEYYWKELSKRHRKLYGNVDNLDKEIINNLLSYFGKNMIFFSVPNDQIKQFITEIGNQHNLSSSQIDQIILSIKDSPLYTSIKNNNTNDKKVVSTATSSNSKKDKEKDKKKK